MKRKRIQPEAEVVAKDDMPQVADIHVANDVELAYLEAGIRIDKNALDDAFVQQPELFRQVSEKYALALSVRDELKDRVKQVEAELYTEVRQQMEESGDKYTEPVLKARVEAHPRRQKMVRLYIQAVRESARWEGLKEAYQQRSWALRELSNLFLAGYFGDASAKVDARANMEREYADNKRKIADARRERYGNQGERRG